MPGTGLSAFWMWASNDAYSAIRSHWLWPMPYFCQRPAALAGALAGSSRRQSASLIALLALGIRNIRAGPTLQPFSPGSCRSFSGYNLMAVTTPEEDLKAILNNA